MKKFLFRLAAILLMIRYFAPVLLRGFKTYSLLGLNMYVWFWILLLLIYDYRRLFSKPYLLLYFFAIVYLFMINIVWSGNIDTELSSQFYHDFLGLFIAISIFDHFVSSGDYQGLGLVATSAVIALGISCLLDIFIYIKTGLSNRDVLMILATQSRSIDISDIGLTSGFIDFYYGISILFPVLMACVKSEGKNNYQRISIILITIISLYSLVIAEYVTALLLAFLGTVFSVVGRKQFRRSLFILVSIVLVLSIIPKSSLGASVGILRGMVRGDTAESRLEDLSVTATYGVSSGYTSHINTRAQRIPFLLGYFFRSPIIGGGPTTEHSFFLDRMSMFGILGILPWLLILIYSIKASHRIVKEEYRFYYFLCVILYLAMGVMKGIPGQQITISMYLIAPGLHYSVFYMGDKLRNKNMINTSEHDQMVNLAIESTVE